MKKVLGEPHIIEKDIRHKLFEENIMDVLTSLTNQIDEPMKLTIDKENELKSLCTKYVALKRMRTIVKKKLDEATSEMSDVEKRIIDLLEAKNKTSQATIDSMVSIKSKEYVTVQKDEEQKQILFDFLKQHGKEDLINVNSQALNSLNKKMQLELAPDDPNWVMPGLDPKVQTNSLSVTKL